MSTEARALTARLLDRSKDRRLQSIAEFRQQFFFSDIDFDAMSACELEVPFVPDPQVMNFESEFTEMPARHSGARVNSKDANGVFTGFHFERVQHRRKVMAARVTTAA